MNNAYAPAEYAVLPARSDAATRQYHVVPCATWTSADEPAVADEYLTDVNKDEEDIWTVWFLMPEKASLPAVHEKAQGVVFRTVPLTGDKGIGAVGGVVSAQSLYELLKVERLPARSSA